MQARCLVVAMVLTATAVTGAKAPLSLRVSPAFSFAPANLVIRTSVEPDAENRSMEVIVLVDPQGKHTNRLLQQLLQHPIEGMQIMTRRQLQKALHGAAPPGRAGKEFAKPHPRCERK